MLAQERRFATTRLICIEGTSKKFWEGTLEGSTVKVRWGKIGTGGQGKDKPFADVATADAELKKLIAEKLGKGYHLDSAPAAEKPVAAPAAPIAPAKRSFREQPLLTKLQKLAADGKPGKLVKEIEAKVPADELSTWLWDAYGRDVLPDHYELVPLLAQHLDKVAPELLGSALTSEAITREGRLYLPTLAERSYKILWNACFYQNKIAYLREHVGAMPRPAQATVWAALRSRDNTVQAPAELGEEAKSLLPDHAASGRMDGLQVGIVCDWFGIDPRDLYEPIVSRLAQMERLSILTLGCVLNRIPSAELLPLIPRLELGHDAQGPWLDWWMGVRRSLVDSPRENLLVFDALRPLIENTEAESYLRHDRLDRVGLGVAQALVAAGEPVPDSLIDIGSDKDDFVERWWPVYATVPTERLLKLRDDLKARLGQSSQYVIPLAGLLGEAEIINELDAMEARGLAQGLSSWQDRLLGSMGKAAVLPLVARIEARTRELPAEPSSADYRKRSVVVGLRSALAGVLGRMSEHGAPVDEAMDRYLLPSPELFGDGSLDHVERALGDGMRRLLHTLPETRARTVVEAWRAYDTAGEHRIDEKLRNLLPPARQALLTQGPTQVERLRTLAKQTSLPCDMVVYAMTEDPTRRAGTLNTLRAIPLGLEQSAVPKAGDEKMSAVVSVDLQQVPELSGRWPSARAICLFVDRPEEGFKESAVIPLSATQCEAGFSNEGRTFSLEKLAVPPQVFAPESAGDLEALKALRRGVQTLPGWVLGAPVFIQEDEDAEGFVLQAGANLTGLNLGDSGALYVYEGSAFWQGC